MGNVSKHKLAFGALWAVWALPVINFALAPSYSPATWPVWLAVVVSAVVALLYRPSMVIAIPFAAMVSPLADASRIASLLPSEIFVAFCLFVWASFAMVRARPVQLLAGDRYLIVIVTIVMLSYLASLQLDTLLKSLINWAALIGVFFISRDSLRNEKHVIAYLYSLVVLALYICVIIVAARANGMVLAGFIAGSEEVFLIQEDITYLFRASYFYTNILYVLGPVSLISLILFFKNTKLVSKILAGLVLVMTIGTLVLMFAKTAFVALGISFLVLLLMYRNWRPRIRSINVIFRFFVPVVLTFSVLAMAIVVVQAILAISEIFEFRTDSLSVRFLVYVSTINELIASPLRLLVGFGPDSSNLLHNDAVARSKSSIYGKEGAIDSGHMTFLFEYGVIYFFAFLLYGADMLLQLFARVRRIGREDVISICAFAIILFVYIAAVTQVVGTSKVAWIIAQYFALAGICLSRIPAVVAAKGALSANRN